MTILNGHILVQQPSPVEGGEIVEVLVTMVTISEVSKEVEDSIMVKDNLPAGFGISVDGTKTIYQTILD